MKKIEEINKYKNTGKKITETKNGRKFLKKMQKKTFKKCRKSL